MQNLYNKHIFYNDTRLIVICFHCYYIRICILSGKFNSQPQVLFATCLITNDSNFSFKLIRIEFLIKISFVITANKF